MKLDKITWSFAVKNSIWETTHYLIGTRTLHDHIYVMYALQGVENEKTNIDTLIWIWGKYK